MGTLQDSSHFSCQDDFAESTGWGHGFTEFHNRNHKTLVEVFLVEQSKNPGCLYRYLVWMIVNLVNHYEDLY